METQTEQLTDGKSLSPILAFCQNLKRELEARGVWVGLPDELMDQHTGPNVVQTSVLRSWLTQQPDQAYLDHPGIHNGADFDWNLIEQPDLDVKISGAEIDPAGGVLPNKLYWAVTPLFFPENQSGLLLAVRQSAFHPESLNNLKKAGHELQAIIRESASRQPAGYNASDGETEGWLIDGDGPDLQQRLRDILFLHKLSLQVGASQDLYKSLQTVVQSLNNILPEAHTVAIMLLDETNILKTAAMAGPTPDRFHSDLQIRPGEGLRGQVAILGQPLYVPMVHNDRRYIEFDPGVHSMLIVPITKQEQILGTLSAESQLPNAFNGYDQNILETAATQAAKLIEDSRLFESERQRTEEVNSLIELGKKIVQSLDIEQVFTTVYQAVTRLMPCDAFYISLREAQSQNTSVTHLIDNGIRYAPARWPIESGLSGYVIRTGEQVLIRETLKESLPFQGVFYGKQDQVRSLIACPLRYLDLTKGMVSCQSYQPSAFTTHDLYLLQSIADHVAIAVENAEMSTDLKNRYLTLQELERVRSEIIQNVSHELRTPLTFLRSYIELLINEQLGSLNEHQKHSLKIIQSRTNSLVRLVDDISTLEATDPDWLKFSDVDLAELVANALQVTEHLARKRGNQLILEVPPNLPTIQADPDRINQVLDNLLGNALKYGQKASKIVVRLETDIDHVIVSVSNQGKGIPAREQERIFERFYQIDGSISRSQSGLGLGLAIVKRIVEAHHGMVWVQSDTETGNTFYFSLPYQPSGSLE